MALTEPIADIGSSSIRKKRRSTKPHRAAEKRPHPDEWRGFGYTGEAHTCLWCGNGLKRHYSYDPHVAMKRSVGAALGIGLGPYEDGYYCSLRCGYQFGARCAVLGDRLG